MQMLLNSLAQEKGLEGLKQENSESSASIVPAFTNKCFVQCFQAIKRKASWVTSVKMIRNITIKMYSIRLWTCYGSWKNPSEKRAITLLFPAQSLLSALLSNSRTASVVFWRFLGFFFKSIYVCDRCSHYDNGFSQGNQFDSLLGSPILFQHPAFALSSPRLEKCQCFLLLLFLAALLLLLLSHSICSDSVRLHRRQPTRLPCPWDSPGKNTGVGCHFLLQCRKVKSESEVAQSCPTGSDPMDFSLPGSSTHGIFQARVLEWGASAFSVWPP